MKTIITILSLLLIGELNAQISQWKTIYYVLDSSGKEVAKRFDTGEWVVANPQIALERLLKEKEAAEKKYDLAVAILRLLTPEGSPTDKTKYIQAVVAYNKFKK